MEDKLRRHIESLFAETTPTKKSVELKEEMIQNLQDKYNDLISEGKTEEAAYNIAVAGIGDISALLSELERDDEPFKPDMQEIERARQKSGMLTAIAVVMYILCVLPIIIMSFMEFEYAGAIGVPVMFVIIAGATGLLVYNSMTKPKYYKGSDTVVEQFREWQSDEHDRKGLRKAISSAMWSIIIAAYLIISFATHAWHVTWIIFILGGVAESLVNILFTMKKRK